MIPEDFSESLESGSSEIEYHFNNYNTDIAKNLRLYLDEGILAFYRSTDPGIQIEVDEVMNVPKQLPWFDIIASAVFMLAFLLGVVVNNLYLMSMERQDGTLQAYHLAPRNIMPSIAARAVIALLSGTITSAVNALLVYIITGRSYLPFMLRMMPTLFVIGLIYFFLSVIVGLLVDSFAGSVVFSLLTTCVLWFMSGATFSIKNNTGALAAVGRFIPNTYALSDIRGVIFGMDGSIGSVGYIAGWLVMLGYLVVTGIIACLTYYRVLAVSHR